MGDIREESMHFVDAILNDREILMPVDDAIKSVAFIEACFESIEKNAPVKL
jgi:predicted dehydrogenase